MKLEIGLLLLLSTVDSRRGGGSRGGGGSSRGNSGGSKYSYGGSKTTSYGSKSKGFLGSLFGSKSKSKSTYTNNYSNTNKYSNSNTNKYGYSGNSGYNSGYRSTGWSGNKPTSWGSNTYSNKQYYGGGTSWSKPSKKIGLSSMTPNPSFGKKSWKSKSALSTMKKTAMLAGGAYLAYKVGKALTPDFDMYRYNPNYYYGYNYGPYYGYNGYSYNPYYASPYTFRGGQYNRYAYKTQSCYTCSSVVGADDKPSNDKCEYMDSKYGWDQLDDFRKVCPQESYCVVTVGRIYPKVDEAPPTITNETSKEEAQKLMANYEGRAFVKRDCIPVDRMDENSCKKFPSTDGLNFDYDTANGEIYQCNVCDTESCNSWGTDAMPDKRYASSAKSITPKFVLLITAILLALIQ